MRLERLEIAGFKSFSDRSELSFDRGVTAIVGPNGCGKSNVADAITWVLGEQSARSLRGEKMEDVIFSGSDARKPTGTAEVRLRLSGVTTLPSGTVTTELAQDQRPRERQRQRSRRGRDRRLADRGRARGVPSRRARRRADSPALSLGRERIPDRRRALPSEGHPRAADGHGPWRQGLRDHRAGQDRPDPLVAPDRSPAADRRSRGHHEVQGAPPLRRAQARSGAAESHARRRHRLRSREAARQSEAAGRQGATASAAARRAAALGEGALRAQVSGARAVDRRRRGAS